MTNPLATFIRKRRLELRLTQQALGQALGVRQSRVHAWEAGLRPFPLAHISRLSAALQADEALLHTLGEGGVPWPRAVSLDAALAPLDPLRCSLETMCETIASGRRVSDLVRAKIGDAAYLQLEGTFLRDTAHELYAAHAVLLDTARLKWSTPLGEGCGTPLVGESGDYEGHLVRLAVEWEREGERVVLFPQVPIPVSDLKPRVDFLAIHAGPRLRPQSTVVELDGHPHTFQRQRDTTRTLKLPFPVIRCDNSAVSLPGFLPWLLDQVRERAAYARVSSEAYSRFLEDRRAQMKRLRDH